MEFAVAQPLVYLTFDGKGLYAGDFAKLVSAQKEAVTDLAEFQLEGVLVVARGSSQWRHRRPSFPVGGEVRNE